MYAKVGQMAYDRNGHPIPPHDLVIEKYEFGFWKKLDNVVEIDVSDGWAIVEEQEWRNFYFGGWYAPVQKRITGLFRITMKGAN